MCNCGYINLKDFREHAKLTLISEASIQECDEDGFADFVEKNIL